MRRSRPYLDGCATIKNMNVDFHLKEETNKTLHLKHTLYKDKNLKLR